LKITGVALYPFYSHNIQYNFTNFDKSIDKYKYLPTDLPVTTSLSYCCITN
jgi:hypothetical protein